MTITEFATLELKAPHTIYSPQVESFLRKEASQQASWSGFPVLFFQDTESPNIIYLVSGWKDIPAHESWIASEQNKMLLQEAGMILEVRGLAHIAIDFETMPAGTTILRFTGTTTNLVGEPTELWGKPLWERSGKQLDAEGVVVFSLRAYSDQGSQGKVSSGSMQEDGRNESDNMWRTARVILVPTDT